MKIVFSSLVVMFSMNAIACDTFTSKDVASTYASQIAKDYGAEKFNITGASQANNGPFEFVIALTDSNGQLQLGSLSIDPNTCEVTSYMMATAQEVLVK